MEFDTALILFASLMSICLGTPVSEKRGMSLCLLMLAVGAVFVLSLYCGQFWVAGMCCYNPLAYSNLLIYLLVTEIAMLPLCPVTA
jgi:hypothetical protein